MGETKTRGSVVKGSKTKFIFVTGGILSGVGKGITAASMGNILKARGLKVNIQKCDQYLNVDAGTLNPAEHGEVFVTKDGAETDLDLGHYERFLDIELTQESSLMSGRVLRELIEGERAGKYLGKTVQVVPHLTNLIQEHIIKASQGFDVHMVEIGGTVGDIEGLSFIESIRELSRKVGRENCIFVHVVYLPYLSASKEFKTKPAQNAVRELRSLGILPDILVARSNLVPHNEQSIRSKLSMFCDVEPDGIVLLPNAETIYEVPLTLEKAGIGTYVVRRLKLPKRRPNLTAWRSMIRKATEDFDRTVTIGVVAKYLDNEDTYLSVFEALAAAGLKHGVGVKIDWIDAEAVTRRRAKVLLKGCDGIVVPGGFGPRGIEGKIAAAEYAIKYDLPYLGLCLGLQVAVIGHARLNGLTEANSTEFDAKSPDPVVSTMAEQIGKEGTGGTMRLGDYECILAKGSLAHRLYGATKIVERHRHRYEINNQYRDLIEQWGMRISGASPDNTLVEMIEIPDHKYFIATQAHPEFKSRPNRPHPLFDGLIAASMK